MVLLFNTAEDYGQTPIAALQVVRRPLVRGEQPRVHQVRKCARRRH
jgi:hypothetical protein